VVSEYIAVSQVLLQPTTQHRDAAVQAAALLYALAMAEGSALNKPREETKKSKQMTALAELITEGCDAEQIWAQIQLAQVRLSPFRLAHFDNISPFTSALHTTTTTKLIST
jgi:hypothetical protein